MSQNSISIVGLIGLWLCIGCGQNPAPVAPDTKAEDNGGLKELRGGLEEMQPLQGASDFDKDKSNSAVFWRWFQDHETELFNFEQDQEAVFDRLSRSLCAVHKDLTFEFGPKEDGCREFVISAGGLKDAFPAVQNLYETRPKFQRFRVTAFRPRRKVTNDVELDGLRIRAADVYYKLCKDTDPRKAGIMLFLPAYSTADTRFGQIAYLLLDEALGEYDVEMKVGGIQLQPHESKEFAGSHPIQGLGDAFDTIMKANMNPPNTGQPHGSASRNHLR
jgi:hypothetical protein